MKIKIYIILSVLYTKGFTFRVKGIPSKIENPVKVSFGNNIIS